ncbi:ATP-binding protein [Paracoccus sp. TK19116]|uniref:histidine kinase n=1 Tax=Paracoccus albicereus TaxID=2922394 RepID=A0ABT1MQR6_9RHOB|nr:ATP-binding protein [Paracoccus albicereus]MCQ0970657.1 ATP-binding protein [Paracoccus albicereus]
MTCAPPPDFVKAAPGPGWEALPLPSLILDGRGRIAALNEAAEVWLNLSRRSALGRTLEGEDLSGRLQVTPPLAPLLHRVVEGDEALYQPHVCFEIGDRAGGHQDRMATVHAGPFPGAGGGVMLTMVASPDAGQRPVKTAARSAIGMAEMLAHEIKNPLAGIRGAAQLMAMNASKEDREMADMIVAESKRIVALLEQVERFGDTSAPNLAPTNVHDVLEQVRQSALAGVARGLSVQTDYDPSLPPALADADKLIQVCLNLVKNAAEALTSPAAAGRGGTIRLRSFYDHGARAPIDDAGHPGRPLPLQIEIEDDGPGLPHAIADQVFEPFVSGRENGTGLGLALVSKIITDHGAGLRVESRPGRTVFRLSLPKA